MDLVRLRYFLAAVEYGTIARAAEKLHVTQPALSKAIKRLEADLDVQLLQRLPRGVSPTPYGEILAAHARLIAVETGHAREAIAALKSGAGGKVVVGAGASMRLDLVPRAIVALLEENAGVEISVVGELYDNIMPDLAQGKLDLTVSMVPDEKPVQGLVHEPLYRDQIHPTVRVGHPLLRQTRITAEQCLDYDWILPTPDNLGVEYLNAFFLSLGLAKPGPRLVTNSTMTALNVIRQSDMIGWHPTQVIGNSGDTGVSALAVPEITLTRKVGISFRKSGIVSVATRLFVARLRHVAQCMIEEGLVLTIE